MTTAVFKGRRDRTHQPSAEPNVIPFIDVLLVLLIIFMVTAPKPTVDLQLEIPNQAGPPVVIEPTIVSLQEAPGGYRVLVNDEAVSFEALTSAVMSRILANDPVLAEADAFADARIYVRSEQNVAYGHVVAVIDELQYAGFEKVGVFAQAAED